MKVHPDSVREQMQRLLRRGPKEKVFREVLTNTADHVSRNPFYYRFFGPYWWVFKALVKKHLGGHKAVWWAGDYDDGVIRKRYSTGNDLYDLCAAMLYQDDHNTNWADAPQRHQIANEDDSDFDTYELFDPDMRRA